MNRYLELTRNPTFARVDSTARSASSAVSLVLYHFCKVRGAKVVTRFLTNEPRWVEPMLDVYTALTGSLLQPTVEDETTEQTTASTASWQERYLVLLWLAHLMYTPFDLATISSETDGPSSTVYSDNMSLKFRIPSVAQKVIHFALEGMSAADRRQPAAAALLTRLAVRPDMRKLGVLDAFLTWAASRLAPQQIDPSAPVHTYIGLLSFVNGVFAAADVDDTGRWMRQIFDHVKSLFTQDAGTSVGLSTSAVAKRMAIKVQRNIILNLWSTSTNSAPDPMSILEDTIEFLLGALSDKDTQVRRASSKALSIIAGRIDPDMAEEIVEAVIASMNEDVLYDRGTKSLQAVNALRWHGLTLTLAQMLFRRQPSAAQLPQILASLYRALSFEQRSAAGSSIGGNVRDAANFGLWSLARRYTTKELEKVDVAGLIPPTNPIIAWSMTSVLPLTACHLLVAACSDPVGNVRRGSSAALQELIGRHPDTVPSGISLVQIVDYHAVGLRQRATVQVANSAAALSPVYLSFLLHALLGWRGIESIDKASREIAAKSLGELGTLCADDTASRLLCAILDRLNMLVTAGQDVEDRHGLAFALAMCIHKQMPNPGPETRTIIQGIFSLLERRPFALASDDFRSISAKPDLTAAGTVKLVQTLLHACVALPTTNGPTLSASGRAAALDSLTLALAHICEADYWLAQETVESVGEFCTAEELVAIVSLWLRKMHDVHRVFRGPALMLAIGAVWHYLGDELQTKQNVVDELVRATRPSSEIETRVLAVRGLGYIVADTQLQQPILGSQETVIFTALNDSLNDYTTNERGDVGSLLRSEALATLRCMPQRWSLNQTVQAQHCYLSACRLAAERLHKVRVEAWSCLRARDRLDARTEAVDHPTVTITDVSTYKYFARLASQIQTARGGPERRRVEAILEGFVSSAGAGNESILDNARFALLFVLESLPATHETQTSLLDMGDAILSLLKQRLTNERVLLPLLELLAFLLDAQSLQRLSLEPSVFRWRTLLSYVQKAHFQSSNMAKLSAAVSIYQVLAGVPQIRAEVMAKLISMLAHPFPRIREAVAEALWTVTEHDALKPVEWLKEPASKAFMAKLKEQLITGAA